MPTWYINLFQKLSRHHEAHQTEWDSSLHRENLPPCHLRGSMSGPLGPWLVVRELPPKPCHWRTHDFKKSSATTSLVIRESTAHISLRYSADRFLRYENLVSLWLTWEAQEAVERATLGESRGGCLTVLPQTLVGVNRCHHLPLSVLDTPLVHGSGCDEGRRADQAQNESTVLQNWRCHCGLLLQKRENIPGRNSTRVCVCVCSVVGVKFE